MKKILITIAAFAAIVFFAGTARAIDLSGLPPELAEKVQLLLSTRFPPNITSISIEPDSPAADEAVVITASISNDAKVTDDETTDAFVQYSVDGGETWEEVEMDQGADRKTWTAEIPGQPSGTEVMYLIRARDTSSNITTDMPCPIESLPYDGYLDKTCDGAEDLTAACAPALPIGCVISMARDETPIDDEDNLIPKHFDMIDYRAGYNDEYLFFDLVTEGKQGPGSASPMDMRIYAVVIANPDRGNKGTDLDSVITQGVAVLYLPLANITGGLVKSCFVGYMKGNDFIQDEGAVTCEQTGNDLFLRVKRSSIGANPSQMLTAIALNGSIKSISPIAGQPYDISQWTTFNFENRKYTVQ